MLKKCFLSQKKNWLSILFLNKLHKNQSNEYITPIQFYNKILKFVFLPLIFVRLFVNPEITKLNFHCEIWIKLFLFCWTFILEWCVCGPIRHGSCSSNLVSKEVTHQTGLAFAIVNFYIFTLSLFKSRKFGKLSGDR